MVDLMLDLFHPPPGTKPWHGGASALGALRGVGPHMAAWKPAPDRHNIWELALHIAYWNYAVWRRISGEARGGFPRSPSNWPAPPARVDANAWKRDRTLLREHHDLLADAMRAFDPGRLDESSGGKDAYTFGDLLMGAVMHDTYHAGQIQIMKRIYASLNRK